MGVLKTTTCDEKKVFVSGLKQMGKDIKTLDKNNIKKQIPNLLTASRILTPICLPIALINPLLALGLLTGFALTDAVDGVLARKWNCQSEFGKMLDPLCDKFFHITVLLPLVLINPIMIPISIVGEIVTAVVNAISLHKNNHPETTKKGKIKTNVLVGSAIATYLSLLVPIPLFSIIVSSSLFALTTVLQGSAIIEYYKVDKEKSKEKKEMGLGKYDSYPKKEEKNTSEVFGYELVLNRITAIGDKIKGTMNPNYRSKKEQIEALKQEREALTASPTEEKAKEYIIEQEKK